MRLAGIIAFTRVVAMAARDITSVFAFAMRLTALLRTATAWRSPRLAVLLASAWPWRAGDSARPAARRIRPRAGLPARRAALLSLRRAAPALRFFAIDWIP